MRPFYLIRHGETDWNRKLRKLQGHSDIPLNDFGIEQAKNLAPLLTPFKINRLISSDLSRASETAQLLSVGLVSVTHPIETTADLREIKLGEAEGKTLQEVDDLYGMDLRRNWSSFDHQFEDLRFPSGESRKEVLHRIQVCLHRFLDLYPSDILAFVAHGYLIRSLVFNKSKIQRDFLVPNCSVVPFIRSSDRTFLYHGPDDPKDLVQAPQFGAI